MTSSSFVTSARLATSSITCAWRIIVSLPVHDGGGLLNHLEVDGRAGVQPEGVNCSHAAVVMRGGHEALGVPQGPYPPPPLAAGVGIVLGGGAAGAV